MTARRVGRRRRHRRTSRTCRRCSATSSFSAAERRSGRALLPAGARALPALRRPRAPGSPTSPPPAGELDAAIRRYRPTVARAAVPEYVIALGEAELAAGQRVAARRHFSQAAAQEVSARSQRREYEHRGRPLRGKPRRSRSSGRPRPPRLGARAQRAVRGCARLGPDTGRPARPGSPLGAASAPAGLTRSALPVPRGHERSRGRPSRPRSPLSCPLAWPQPPFLAALRTTRAEGARELALGGVPGAPSNRMWSWKVPGLWRPPADANVLPRSKAPASRIVPKSFWHAAVDPTTSCEE